MFKSNLLRKIYSEPSKEHLLELIIYLDYISGKKLTSVIINQYLFTLKWKARDIKIRSRCNCKAASMYLGYLNASDFNLNWDKIKITIADIVPHVSILDSNQDCTFVGNTNTLPSTIYYKHAQCLFYNNDLPSESKNSYDTDLLVIYALRLSLEKRIKGFLGIDYVTTKGKPIGLSSLIKIAKGLKSIEYGENIYWQEIELINTWLNLHMHRHLRPNPWIIHQAFRILDSLLQPTSHKFENRIIYSFYGSTIITDEDQVTEEILLHLKSIDKDVTVKWSNDKEILKL